MAPETPIDADDGRPVVLKEAFLRPPKWKLSLKPAADYTNRVAAGRVKTAAAFAPAYLVW
jgi:hypothetical protein